MVLVVVLVSMIDLGMETKAAECQEWLMLFRFSHPPLEKNGHCFR